MDNPNARDGPARSLSFRVHRRVIAAMFAAVLVGWSAGALAQSAAQLPMLLSSPAASRAAVAQPEAQGQDLAVARQRPVAIDFRYLDPQSGNAATRIGVELFDGQVLTLDLDRVEQRGPGNYTWYGRIPGQNTGHAILTVVNGQMAGSIVLFDSGVRSGRDVPDPVGSERNPVAATGRPERVPAGSPAGRREPAGRTRADHRAGGRCGGARRPRRERMLPARRPTAAAPST